MLKVTIINAVYPPEPVVSSQIGRDLVVHLTGKGVEVTVLCPFPTRPMGAQYPGYRNNDSVSVVQEDGVEVVRLPSFTAPKSLFLSRMRESFSFGRHVCHYLKKHLAEVDVVYANTWPLLGQAFVARYCNRRGIPLVLHIQDVYPESLLCKLPLALRGVVAFPLTTLDRWTVRQAARVVVISENMRRTYVEGRGLAPEKVITVPNWMDESRFACLPKRADACGRYGVSEEKFTFLYLGNVGPVAGVDGLINAFHAARLKQAQLVIVGDGSAKAACIERVKRLGASGVLFISDSDVGNVPLLQSLAHVCLLPLRKGAGMSSMPSKLPAYMFSAKPVLATVDEGSDTARCIRDANCGWVGEPENEFWLAKKMAEVTAMPVDALSLLGHQGRAYGLRHFSKAEGVQRLGAVVINAAKKSLVQQTKIVED
jgi:glycosyltransferase involved in cell wall biosynthesis